MGETNNKTIEEVKADEMKTKYKDSIIPILLTFIFLNGFLEYYLFCKYILREEWEKSFKRFTSNINYLALLLYLTIFNYLLLYWVIF